MLESFIPDIVVSRLSLDFLEDIIERNSLSYISFDIDGVLMHRRRLDNEVIKILPLLDLDKYIISNRFATKFSYKLNKKLAKEIEEKTRAVVIPHIKKPFSSLYIDGKGAMIGSNILIDVFFAKRNGLYSVLVRYKF